MGVTLPSIDAMLAEIDRALTAPLQLPDGGPVATTGDWCWADKRSTFAYTGTTIIVPCTDLAGENGIGLCDPHYEENGDIFDLAEWKAGASRHDLDRLAGVGR